MSAFANIAKIPELRRRILFTLGMLAVYRIGIFVTTPGVDRNVMREYVQQSSGTFLGMFNLFSGGALEQMSIFALGIMPYVSASIILQLMTVVVPQLEELRKEGEAGQRKINQYTRYGTILLSVIQSMSIAIWLESLNAQMTGGDVVHDPGWGFRFLTVVSLTTGTAFIMWLGEQITERGIGNGISLIIFAGIVAGLPDAAFQTFKQVEIGQIEPVTLLMISGIVLAVIGIICFFERGQRRLPIHYAKRMVGRKLYGGQTSHLPLRVNMSGVIPPIFASSLLMFPKTLADYNIPGMADVNDMLTPGTWQFTTVYVVMIIFFCFFYTAVTFQPVEVADNLKKQNAFIPGVRPGKQTADYIDRVVTRITVIGAIYVAAVCTVPDVLRVYFAVPFYFGGTSIMIVVGVALDTVSQIESHLITRHYEGLTGPKGPRIRGRRG
ncbi:MAG: preprotein translocase subunit SecY [Sandaracinaceae bacterium]|nr:MAG: preprotein translocase subunit SecY [Sandaracinaceae bacterium]